MKNRVFKEIVRYHEGTKHHFHRFAKSLGYMDWENQPNPFRFYEGDPPLALAFLKEDPQAPYMGLYSREKNPPRAFNLENVAGFLELSLGLSAWKGTPGSKWSLRMNPSSGNLHPTEGHLILPEMESLEGGVYHYNAFTHALERRAAVSRSLWERLHKHFKTDGFLVALSSIFWRESWKYGERAFRYCNHDVGHALACLSFAANLQGWKVTFLNALSDEQIETVLGFDKAEWKPIEAEHAGLLCFVHRHHTEAVPRDLPRDVVAAFADLGFVGTPNALSKSRIQWGIIYKTASLTRKPETAPETALCNDREFLPNSVSSLTAAQIIRQRRSAVAFDGEGFITKAQFFTMLDKTIPRQNCAPFDVGLMAPAVHLLIFVHNVRGLEQGLYFFNRNENDLNEVKRLSHAQFSWAPVQAGFPLYFLQAENLRRQAMRVSCQQEIAGQSAFSLGMIARFSDIVQAAPYRYRHLFWETGMIGQVLYLEAEAHGVRGTGIGCFFDDPVHDIMGLKDNAFQSLYHFTIGKPLEDRRLTTFPPYHHLERRQNPLP